MPGSNPAFLSPLSPALFQRVTQPQCADPATALGEHMQPRRPGHRHHIHHPIAAPGRCCDRRSLPCEDVRPHRFRIAQAVGEDMEDHRQALLHMTGRTETLCRRYGIECGLRQGRQQASRERAVGLLDTALQGAFERGVGKRNSNNIAPATRAACTAAASSLVTLTTCSISSSKASRSRPALCAQATTAGSVASAGSRSSFTPRAAGSSPGLRTAAVSEWSTGSDGRHGRRRRRQGRVLPEQRLVGHPTEAPVALSKGGAASARSTRHIPTDRRRACHDAQMCPCSLRSWPDQAAEDHIAARGDFGQAGRLVNPVQPQRGRVGDQRTIDQSCACLHCSSPEVRLRSDRHALVMAVCAKAGGNRSGCEPMPKSPGIPQQDCGLTCGTTLQRPCRSVPTFRCELAP